jgi:isoquinoline 1-oxidoreductase beta subunit
MTVQTTRRAFLQSTAAAGAVLVIGTNAGGAFAAGPAEAEVNPFVRIRSDGTVEAVIKHFEMGQGTTTGLTTLIAEELDADWDKVVPVFAPADDERYKNLFFGAQGTGGSTAIANSFMQYRTAAATARDMLVRAAAETWGVPVSAVTVEDGLLKAGTRSAHFGEVVATAATLQPSAEVGLKDPSRFKLIGAEGLLRKDSAAKTDGTATFAIDVKVPGMVYAVILRSPRFGGTLLSFDASGAADVPGFVDAKALANKAGVAVFARNTWAAMQARDAVTAEWDFSAAEGRSTSEMIDYHRELTAAPQFQARPDVDLAATAKALADADTIVEAEIVFPFLAHAPMEPINCVIEPTATGVRLHDGCQFPGGVKPTIAGVLGLEPANVEIVTVYAGGSFGRRANTVSDYQVEAALAFAALGGTTPVKLVWTREDDIRGGFYRPIAVHTAKVALKDGAISGWDHRIAAKPIMKGGPFENYSLIPGTQVDSTSVEGVHDTHYAIPQMTVGLSDAETATPVLWWRSVGHTHTAYAMETLVDQVAEALGVDPVDYRLRLLSGGDKDQKRLSGVLKLAAEKAGWGQPVPGGKGRGVAVHKSFNSYVAEVVDVSVVDGAIKIDKVTCAVDCGIAVNPDVIRAQMEGGIGYGLGSVMRNQITFTEGEVDQLNFPDYEPLRISDMPAVEVHIVASTEAPTGVGEPGTPPSGPALANAIYAATGKRVTRLPMVEDGIEFV